MEGSLKQEGIGLKYVGVGTPMIQSHSTVCTFSCFWALSTLPLWLNLQHASLSVTVVSSLMRKAAYTFHPITSAASKSWNIQLPVVSLFQPHVCNGRSVIDPSTDPDYAHPWISLWRNKHTSVSPYFLTSPCLLFLCGSLGYPRHLGYTNINKHLGYETYALVQIFLQ